MKKFLSIKKALLVLFTISLFLNLISLTACESLLERCNHNYLGEVILEPTCEECGTKCFECTACGHKYNQTLEPYWHTDDGEGYCERCELPLATGIEYELSNDETYYAISDVQYNNALGTCIIPSEHEGLPIKEIYANSFLGCNARCVKISPSIEYVRKDAFYNNKTIEEVVLGRNVKHIGESAFEDTFIFKIEFYDKVGYIGLNAFNNCMFLDTVLFSGTENDFEKIEIMDGNDVIIENIKYE